MTKAIPYRRVIRRFAKSPNPLRNPKSEIRNSSRSRFAALQLLQPPLFRLRQPLRAAGRIIVVIIIVIVIDGRLDVRLRRRSFRGLFAEADHPRERAGLLFRGSSFFASSFAGVVTVLLVIVAGLLCGGSILMMRSVFFATGSGSSSLVLVVLHRRFRWLSNDLLLHRFLGRPSALACASSFGLATISPRDSSSTCRA